MQIDLLRTESQRAASFSESHGLHLQNACVEITRHLDVLDGKNEMIDAVYRHG
jgi:hypothetical protein